MKNKYINKKSATAFLSIFIMLLSLAPKVSAQSFTEGFENLAALTDWYVTNNSDNASTTFSWFKGLPATFIAQAGTDSSYVASNYQVDSSTTVAGTLSSWLFTPNRIFNNGDVITFYSRTVANPATWADNLQVRFSGNGTSLNVGATSASVGDFTTLLLEINPTQSLTVYPAVWTQYTITISGLAGATSGRVAFRYYVTNGGSAGASSYYIGVDTYSYTSNTTSSDATVSNVYTLGTIAKPFINPHVVTANITNTGSATLTNKVVTLNVSGANIFTNTQTIASLAAGASTLVTFTGYTSNNVGTNTVTVSVPADAVALGNSIVVSQTVNTSSYNYAYGTTVDNGVGFPASTGDIAVKFSTSSATSIASVNVNNNVAGEPIHLDIWDATGAGGTPGTLLYSSSSFTSIVGIQPITVSPAVAVNGAFYVGLTQEGATANMAMSGQVETPLRLGKFYFQAPTGAGTWTDFSGVVDARVMIEPVFSSCTVAPAQPGTITGTATVCQTSSNTYSVVAVSGASSYNWTLPSGWSGSSTSNSISTSAGASSGNITVSATNACGTSTTQTFAVTVNPVPAQPGTIAGNSTICPSSSNTYSVAAVSGATSYTWTLPSGWSGASTSNSIFTTAGVSGGIIMVTATNACGTSSSSVLTITVSSAPPQPGVITGNTTFCSGSTNTYSIVAISGATSYAWTLPVGWSGSSTTNSISATAGANGGTISVTYTNACGTSPAQTLSVTPGTAPAQPGAISGVTTFCPGQPQTYTVANVAGVTYNWTLPSGWAGSSTSNSISATTGANGGTVSVTATNSCGTSAAQTLTVSLGSAPAQPGAITGSASICAGGPQTYSVSPVAGAVSYVWNLPAGWGGGSNSNSITTITNTTGGVVSVAAVNDCGTSTLQTLTVTVNSVPTQPVSISGSNAVCSGISGIYSITPVAGATSYTWTLPGGWSGSSTTSSITATANGGSGNILVTVTNSCGTSPSQSLSVTVSSAAPTQPGTITGNTTMCSAATTTYTIANVAGATSYNWTLPVGWTGTSTTNSITVVVGTSGGSIAVAAANGCGTSSAQTLAVTVNQSPAQPTVINGAAVICGAGTQTYSVATVSGATSYTWTPPSGWVGSSINSTITYTPGASGTISVTANNSTCSSPAQTLAVTVSATPTTPTAISGSVNVCSGANENYSVTPVAGATTYTWTLPSGWSGTSTTNSLASTVGTTSGNITVTATNICGTSSAQTLAVTTTLTLSQPGAIVGANPACSGSTQTYSIPPVAGAVSYTWTLPSGGWSGTSSTDSITVVVGSAGAGNLTVTATNSCGTSPSQGNLITVNAVPATPTITALGNTLSSSVATTYQWYFNSVMISGATSQIYVATQAGFYTVVVTNAALCSATSAQFISNVGINENELDNLFSVYPNPSHDVINIKLTANKTVEAASITNVLGKTLIVINPKNIKGNDVLAVDVKELSQGIYFLSMQVDGRMITKKIIVE